MLEKHYSIDEIVILIWVALFHLYSRQLFLFGTSRVCLDSFAQAIGEEARILAPVFPMSLAILCIGAKN